MEWTQREHDVVRMALEHYLTTVEPETTYTGILTVEGSCHAQCREIAYDLWLRLAKVFA